MAARIAVVVEASSKRSFASAIDWPGWCRSGRSPDDALTALDAYRDRYRPIAAAAGVRLPASGFDVVESLPGTAVTDFGAPAAVASADSRRLSPAARRRSIALLESCWAVFDDVAARAPMTLRKGPRGGGRDRDAIVDHLIDAERAYARKIGLAMSAAEWRDGGIEALRTRIVAALADEGSPDDGWPHGYFIRRTAWHVTDHLWEIEDRSAPTKV